MAEKVCLGVTPGGKSLYASNKPNRSVLEIYFEEGGVVPSELSGAFSDITSAKAAVAAYLDRPFKKAGKK